MCQKMQEPGERPATGHWTLYGVPKEDIRVESTIAKKHPSGFFFHRRHYQVHTSIKFMAEFIFLRKTIYNSVAEGKSSSSLCCSGIPTAPRDHIPSNVLSSTYFLGKTFFFSKIFLGDPPLNFLEVCQKFRSMER